ncbi:7TM diverse intracellular signaling domain-containing protein [Tumidithrix elongata RA019]|uniref:Circadian input-output histidine kinase CikA n=1 Tax=Tumidithrix elongata BACA0141 TaxID=2716417 RepID=A0AAW9Q0N5_9CYAN|nr:7TM diverse intracellular signaling domain-containing protein [Tumidithrix elongata RA019]
MTSPQRSPLLDIFFAILLIVALALLSLPLQVLAYPSSLILQDAQDRYPLGPYLEILEDKSAQWTIDAVNQPPLSQQFVRNQTERPSYGFTHSAYWVRLHLRNQASPRTAWRLEIGYPLIDRIALYLPDERTQQPQNVAASDRKPQKWIVKYAGDSYPFAIREVDDRLSVFKLPLVPQAEQTIFLRFETTSSLPLHLTLWSLEAFAQHRYHQQFLLGGFYGILLVMSGYNLILFLVLKERSYFYYVLFVLSGGTWVATTDGFGLQYLWPEQIWWNNVAIIILAAIAAIAVLNFMNEFLQTKIYSPRLRRIILSVNFLWLCIIAAAVFGSYRPVAQMAVALLAISCTIGMTVGVQSWQRGYRPARYYLIGYSLVLIGAFAYCLTLFNLIPSNFFTDESLRLGLVFMVFMLSLALGDRINLLKQEKVEAQVEVMREQQEALRLKDEWSATLQKAKDELEQRVAERTKDLKQAKETADLANRTKSEFLANMSHELRTPLNAILGFSQIMGGDSSLTAEQLENLSIIRRSGDHLLELINDILDMSKIEAGYISFNQNSFDLYKFLNSLEEIFALRASSKKLQFMFEYSPNLPQFIQTDEGKLRQILINLLGNAIKFTNYGSITLRVSATSDGFQDPTAIAVHFEIEDTGVGISADELDLLFQPFVQTASGKQSQQGTGLGLPISQKFIQLLGGEVKVRSAIGQGTTFQFWIQACLGSPIDQENQAPRQRAIALAPDLPIYRILVVDDVWENRQLILKTLSPIGFELKEAENGEVAVALWESWKPHLIWMDMRMPILDGYEATSKIRERERLLAEKESMVSNSKFSKTVIIALTASAFEEKRSLVLAAGCDDYVRKPVQQETVFAKIAEHLGVRYLYADSSSSLEREITNKKITNKEKDNQAVRHSLRILLAEDNIVNQKVAIKMLKNLGYTADLANNGLEVLEILNRQDYDVIFMDMQMPEMDGLEATIKIREMERDRKVMETKSKDPCPFTPIKIIAMTANSLTENFDICIAAGMDDFIAKPVRLEALKSILESI